VFVNLTAVYDTVWHRGLICKVVRLPIDRHMVSMIMELVGHRNFALTTGNKNGAGYDTSRIASHRDSLGTPSPQHLHF